MSSPAGTVEGGNLVPRSAHNTGSLSPAVRAEIAAIPPETALPLDELIEICAVDSEFYGHHFFPRTFRAPSPRWADDVWSLLEDETTRLKNIIIYRDGAKTTRARVWTSKRVAFGTSRNIFYVSKSEAHAIRSLDWLRRQVEWNSGWAQTFGLRKGKKWGGPEIEIFHGIDEEPIWVLASGITGTVRGVNRDDYRPSTIVLDDILDDENCNTAESVAKIEKLVHGAIKNSLADPIDSPNAALAMLNTPQARGDPCQTARGDPEWASIEIGCWTPATADLPVADQVSNWPERWPTEFMRDQKRAAISMNRLSIFTREKEVRLVSPETSAFKREWLRYWDTMPARHEMAVALWIDPVPPPSERQIAQRMEKKDFEALAVVGLHRKSGRFLVLETRKNRGHEPNWTIAAFFDLCSKWRPNTIAVEGTAYQRTLKWILEQAMQERRIYYPVDARTDMRSKFDKITDGLAGIASQGMLFMHASHLDLIGAFTDYPDVSHDDELEAVAQACHELYERDVIVGDYEELEIDEEEIPALPNWRAAP